MKVSKPKAGLFSNADDSGKQLHSLYGNVPEGSMIVGM